jgi:hypothetical protein
MFKLTIFCLTPCNTRRMVETAAHLAAHVFPRLPVRHWVLSVPKRLRYHLQHDPTIETLALRIFLSVVGNFSKTLGTTSL